MAAVCIAGTVIIAVAAVFFRQPLLSMMIVRFHRLFMGWMVIGRMDIYGTGFSAQ